MNDKYLLVGVKYGKSKRGAHTTSLRLVEHLSSHFDYIEHTYVRNLNDLNEKYKKIIFTTQVPHLYHFDLNFINTRTLNYGIYIRSEHNHLLYNSISNGFSYYKQDKTSYFSCLLMCCININTNT